MPLKKRLFLLSMKSVNMPQQHFIHLNLAFSKFCRDLKQGKLSYPKFKKKKENQGFFYLGGDTIRIIQKDKTSYIKIPNIGSIKMHESLRFQGKIHSITISQRQINAMLF